MSNRAAHPILAEIEAFLKRTNMPQTTFGKRAVGDPNLVRQLREGRRLWAETEEKVRAVLDAEDAA